MKAYQIEDRKRDEFNWMLGVYVESAVSVAVERNLAGKKAKGKYLDKPLLQMAEDEDEELSDEELNARIAKAIAIEDYNISKQKAYGMKAPDIKGLNEDE